MSKALWVEIESQVTCPSCQHQFSLQEGFASQALEALVEGSTASQDQWRAQERASAERRAQLAADERLRAFEQQLGDERQKNRQLQAEQLALREERQKLKDERESLALTVQREVDTRLGEREARARAAEQERSALEKAELHKTIEDMQAKLAEAQQKAVQGSQQLQGEVLELALEQGLAGAFPFDVIEEVRKGQRGGDVIQRVTTRSGQQAGTVLWETKRARDWSPQWLTKLKEDMRSCNAEIGVLVTSSSAMPREWPPAQLFGLHDEVWVTSWSTAMPLAAVLRSGLLDAHKQRAIAAGKGEKMEAVYDYLTSPQFAHKLKAVYGAFQRMREELEQEKSVTMQRWARREKQLQSGVTELLGVAGDLQGLAQQLPMLDLEPQTPRQLNMPGAE